MPSKHQIRAVYLLLMYVVNTSWVAVAHDSSDTSALTALKADDKWIYTNEDILLPLQTTNQSARVTFEDIPSRSLMRKATTMKVPTDPSYAAAKSKGKCSSSRRGVQNKNCESYSHTIFVQIWLPAVSYTNKISRDNDKDWNQNLKIHGLRPVSKLPKDTTPWPPQIAIDQQKWPNVWDEDIYEREWNQYGRYSGFKPLDYLNEMYRLHNIHLTQPQIKLTEQQTISLNLLRRTFKQHAFVVCKERDEQQYFYEVRFCHKVDPETHLAQKRVVEYTYCEDSIPAMECTQNEILITHDPYSEKEATGKCSSSTTSVKNGNKEGCGSYEYTFFVQNWLPARMYVDSIKVNSSSHTARFPQLVEDWNNNIKIHGLWPQSTGPP